MTKENLEKKLITLEEQISNILNLKYNKEKKKLDMKSYLENFERDKRKCEKFVEVLEKDGKTKDTKKKKEQ